MKNKTFIIVITLFAVFSMSIFICLNRDKNILKEEVNNNNLEQSIAVYIKQENGNYEKSNSIPNKDAGYQLNETKSICDGTASISWNKNEWGLELANIDKDNMKCYLYFDRQLNAKDTILSNNTISERTDFTSIITENTTGTIYTAEDDDGISYYYAGAVDDNWVKFAGFYWRIIRINGNGSIRLIYNGTSPVTTGTGTQLSNTSAFNSSYNTNIYVGFKYTSNQAHGTGTDSEIKWVLDNWYTSNLASYASKIDTNAGFCNDRQPSTDSNTSNGQGGLGGTATYYGPYIRLYGTTKGPSLKCQNISTDYFTVSGASKGNKALQYPIGLLTMDEAYYAGGYSVNNTSYYLRTNQYYWTMSPNNYNLGANEFLISPNGALGSSYMDSAFGVRPVINLRADTIFSSGDGTASNPYIVE